jgi:hypothetical protein
MRNFSSLLIEAILGFALICALIAPRVQAQNIYDGTSIVDVQRPDRVTASGTNATSFVNQGYQGKGFIVLVCTNTAGTNPTFDVRIQGENDVYNTNWVDITAAAFTQSTGSNSVLFVPINFGEAPLYLRATNTIGGTGSPSYVWSMFAIVPKKYK